MVETVDSVRQEKKVQPHSYEAAFTPQDWALLAGTALMWGSSFVLIEEALEAFEPPLIAFLRILLGAITIALFPKARTKVARSDLPATALLGLIWMAVPFLLFPIAQQWIDSSLAGMLNGGVPIFATLIAVIVSRRSPGALQVTGIALGFLGVVVVGLPYLGGSNATALGVVLVLLACICYGAAINVAVPLQRRYGALPVLLRTQLFAMGFTLVPALISLPGSTFSAGSAASIIPLGALGTGLAFVTMTTLVGRVGPSRGSVTIYFVPVVAITLGAIIRSESIEVISLIGTAMVLLGAFLASRQEAPAGIEASEPPHDVTTR